MTEKQMRDMIAEIVQELDYDIYKELFVHGRGDDDAEYRIENLMEIVQSYVQSDEDDL